MVSSLPFRRCVEFRCARARDVEMAVQYNRDVRLILSDRCFRCHGPGLSQTAKPNSDSMSSASALGPRKDPAEHAIVPGHPDQSVLIRRILSKDPGRHHAARASHLTLTDSKKETLRKWVEQGAKYEPHWAFVPLPSAFHPGSKRKNLAAQRDRQLYRREA